MYIPLLYEGNIVKTIYIGKYLRKAEVYDNATDTDLLNTRAQFLTYKKDMML